MGGKSPYETAKWILSQIGETPGNDPINQAIGIRVVCRGSTGFGTYEGKIIEVGYDNWRVLFDDGDKTWKSHALTLSFRR